MRRYGDFVLLRPPVKPATWLLWFGPLALLIVGLAASFLWVRRRALAKDARGVRIGDVGFCGASGAPHSRLRTPYEIDEEEIERRYHQNQMKTPIHLVIGQEATSVGCCAALGVTDFVYSSHRTHGAGVDCPCRIACRR